MVRPKYTHIYRHDSFSHNLRHRSKILCMANNNNVKQNLNNISLKIFSIFNSKETRNLKIEHMGYVKRFSIQYKHQYICIHIHIVGIV